MADRPKFSVFRPWVERSLSKKTNGERPRLVSLPTGEEGEEQQANIKLAGIFAVVALLFVLAEHFGRVQKRTDANLGPDSIALVSLTLSPPERSRDRAAFSVRFRLSNRGNHSIFYPISTATSMPIGHLVARASPTSDWMSSSNISKQRVPSGQEFLDPSLTWIEMPPGGWVDGEFHDAGESPEEHAYAIYVKPARNANGSRIISKSYPSSAN
jgi:hypothetical protein